MSLILDALRKSEAERRRGQSPELLSAGALAPATRRVAWGRWLPIVLGTLLLLAAVVLLSWRFSDRGAAMDPPAGEARPADAATEAPTSPPTRVVIAPGPPPVELPTRADEPAKTASEPRPVAAQPTPPEQAEIPPARPVPSVPAAVTSPDPATVDADAEPLPPITILQASERAGLPPLKLSMHVYSSEPSKRFAIVDGQRVTEGSTVGSGVIEQIRRDGVVIGIAGRRLLLPRP